MRNLATAVIALITAVAGTALTLLVANYLTQLYRVSDFEGQRGYFMVFILAPAGFLGSLAIGIVVARMSHAVDLGGFARAQGLALLVTVAAIGVISGFLWLVADRPPMLDGKQAGLELEVRMPMDSTVPKDLHAADLHVSVYENDKYNRYAELELDSAVVADGFLVVKGTASLFTRNAERSLLVAMGFEENPAMFEMDLPRNPTAQDTAWTGWRKPGRAADLSRPMTERKYEVRWRVVGT